LHPFLLIQLLMGNWINILSRAFKKRNMSNINYGKLTQKVTECIGKHVGFLWTRFILCIFLSIIQSWLTELDEFHIPAQEFYMLFPFLPQTLE
jgi:flagellar biosynthesis protein FlhB